ncbi:MAG TPA: NAD(P)/FAD-dependent oxidoreductase [Lapillicoccus sp.]|nr:NAD(P)/FAD-dependent oxidoreductase [Lapillicoccus sp.]
MESIYDVIVIGGGPAGLSGATALARSRRRVLVLDHGRPRNTAAGHLHNFLSRDGTSPGDLLAIGRAEVESFGGVVEHAEVVDVVTEDDGMFAVRTEAGVARARRVLVTTGLADRLPDIPGVADRWGRDVLHCPYCHGYEVRDQAVGILAAGPLAGHAAGLWRQLSDRVTVFVHDGPPLEPADRERLDALGVSVVEGAVAELVVEADRLTGIRLESGEVVPVEAVVVAPVAGARAGFLTTLGLATVDVEMAGRVVATRLETDQFARTSVPGVWAAGSVVEPMAQLMASAASGLMAGAQINADLVESDLAAVLESRRVAVS